MTSETLQHLGCVCIPVALSKSFSPPFLLFPCSHIGRLIFLKYRRQAPAPGPLHLIFPLPVTFQVSSIFFHSFVALAQLLSSLSEIPSLTMQYKMGIPYEPTNLPSPSHILFSLPQLALFCITYLANLAHEPQIAESCSRRFSVMFIL